MSTEDESKSKPKSMRHKRILDAAKENPNASMDELASQVPSATSDLVERVFDKYGDPAAEANNSANSEKSMSPTNESTSQEDDSDLTTATADSVTETEEADEKPTVSEDNQSSKTEPDGLPSLNELTEEQHSTLEVIAAQPKATQKEIADHMDVTRATISRWANDIKGFEWTERKSFVEAIFDEEASIKSPIEDGGPAAEAASADADVNQPNDNKVKESSEDTVDVPADIESKIDSLNKRITEVEESLDGDAASDTSVFDDPELVHKIVHACLESNRVSESEELTILKNIINRATND